MKEEIIQIGGKFYKEAQVVMLLNRGENFRNSKILTRLDKMIIGNKEEIDVSKYIGKYGYKGHHLYFLSDEKIKEGDWILHKNTIHQVRINKGLYLTLEGLEHIDVRLDLCKKIIATTDLSLVLSDGRALFDGDGKPKIGIIAQSFIEYYIEQYNKGNIITKVMVEYRDDTPKFIPIDKFNSRDLQNYITPKINPKDNTINIKPINDNLHDGKLLEYWKQNAEENYLTTPISVLKYITILEEVIKNNYS